jgi:hypothetical protein
MNTIESIIQFSGIAVVFILVIGHLTYKYINSPKD